MEQLLGSDLRRMLTAGARLLENNKEIINAMNTFPVPDGDTGTNMSLTMRSALAEVEKVGGESVAAVASAVASGSLLGAREIPELFCLRYSEVLPKTWKAKRVYRRASWLWPCRAGCIQPIRL